MFKVVLDTNIIVSALLKENSIPAFILLLTLQDKIRLYLTNEIFSEYQGVLKRKKFKSLSSAKVDRLLSQIKKQALWVKPRILVNAIQKDPADNKFLECAAEADADFLITGNTRHFSFKQFNKTKIVTPREFINLILNNLILINP